MIVKMMIGDSYRKLSIFSAAEKGDLEAVLKFISNKVNLES